MTDIAPGVGASDRSIRVLHVTQPVTEGVAVVVADLALHQHAAGWDVHVACPPDGWLAGRLAEHGVRVHTWHATRSPGPSSLAETRALAAVVGRVAPDVVHLHSSKAGLAGRLAVRGRVPTAFQPHAWSFQAAEGLVGRASAVWERLATRWTDLVVAVSSAELDEGARHGVVARRSIVAPNGVDVVRFAPADRAAARRRLGLPDDASPLVLCIGRLARQKGQDLLLAAWPDVLARVPGARLALVGEGPEREALTEVAATLPGVALHGNTECPQDWYAAADVVAVPSRWEGMALVPLEAMAGERPVVGFDVTGMAESLDDCGAVVPVGDVAALADAIAVRLERPDLALDEGRRGRARATARFDRDQAAKVTTEAIRSLAARPARRAEPAARPRGG